MGGCAAPTGIQFGGFAGRILGCDGGIDAIDEAICAVTCHCSCCCCSEPLVDFDCCYCYPWWQSHFRGTTWLLWSITIFDDGSSRRHHRRNRNWISLFSPFALLSSWPFSDKILVRTLRTANPWSKQDEVRCISCRPPCSFAPCARPIIPMKSIARLLSLPLICSAVEICHSKSNRANRPAFWAAAGIYFAPHQPGDNKPHIDSNLRITNFHMRLLLLIFSR